jgi:hypothetical protein
MAINEICQKGCKCERCSHEWVPRLKNRLPIVCAKCASPYWNIPKKKKTPVKPISIGGSSGSRGSSVRPAGRGGRFSTAVRASNTRSVPKAVKRYIRSHKPTQKEIDRAGIGGAT